MTTKEIGGGEMEKSFDRLRVVRFDDGEWPDRRVSLRADYENHAVMISPRFTDLDVAQTDAKSIALAVNYHDRLVELVSDAMEDETEFDTEWNIEARALLAELSAHNGGEG